MADAPATNAPPAAEPTWEDLQKQMPSLAKFKTPLDAAKSYPELERALGGKMAVPDWKDSKAVAEFNKKIGVPESPDKYPQLDDALNPKNVPVSPEFKKNWYAWAHKAGLRPDQANAMAQELFADADRQLQQENIQSEIQRGEVQKRMQETFGTALPQVQEEVTRFLNLKGELDAAKANGVFENPDLLRAFHKMSRDYAEDRSITKPEHRGTSGMVPAQLVERKNELMKTPEYLNGSHPQHMARLEEVRQLNILLAESTGGNKVHYEVKKMR
jgi:hypothetical protein